MNEYSSLDIRLNNSCACVSNFLSCGFHQTVSYIVQESEYLHIVCFSLYYLKFRMDVLVQQLCLQRTCVPRYTDMHALAYSQTISIHNGSNNDALNESILR
jgi:hypothetical protein